jgi:hypothetical protein
MRSSVGPASQDGSKAYKLYIICHRLDQGQPPRSSGRPGRQPARVAPCALDLSAPPGPGRRRRLRAGPRSTPACRRSFGPRGGISRARPGAPRPASVPPDTRPAGIVAPASRARARDRSRPGPAVMPCPGRQDLPFLSRRPAAGRFPRSQVKDLPGGQKRAGRRRPLAQTRVSGLVGRHRAGARAGAGRQAPTAQGAAARPCHLSVLYSGCQVASLAIEGSWVQSPHGPATVNGERRLPEAGRR